MTTIHANLPASNTPVVAKFDYHAAYNISPNDVDMHYGHPIDFQAAYATAAKMDSDITALIKKGDNKGVADALSDPAACWLMKNFGARTDSPISVALHTGNFDVLPALLDKTATFKKLDEYANGKSHAVAAIFTGRPDVVRMFIDAGEKLSNRDGVHRLLNPQGSVTTAFGLAVEQYGDKTRGPEQNQKDLEILGMVSKFIDLNDSWGDQITPLIKAIHQGHDETVITALCDAGADIHQKDKQDCSAITHAASAANLAALKHLVSSYTPTTLNAEKSEYGESLLLIAIRSQGKPQIDTTACAKLLIDSGLDIDFQPTQGKPPLFEAIEQGNDSVVKLLLERGAKTEYTGGNNQIVSAKNMATQFALADSKYIAVARCLLDNNEMDHLAKAIDVTADKKKLDRYVEPYTLSMTDDYSSDGLSKHLSNIRDRGMLDDVLTGNPILHKAVMTGTDTYTLETLLKFVPANMIDARGQDGRTALQLAAAQGKALFVTALLDAKASPIEKDNQGYTALALAVLSRAIDSITALLGLGSTQNAKLAASLEETDTNGKTALLIAVENGDHEIAELLLAAGANIKATDNDRKGVQDWAISDQAKELLKKYDATIT